MSQICTKFTGAVNPAVVLAVSPHLCGPLCCAEAPQQRELLGAYLAVNGVPAPSHCPQPAQMAAATEIQMGAASTWLRVVTQLPRSSPEALMAVAASMHS